MIDPIAWTLPDPAAITESRNPASHGRRVETWAFTQQISSVDLYSYLKHRFGEANGLAMGAKRPGVDNLVHWHYTIASGAVLLNVLGLDQGNQLAATLLLGADTPNWPHLEQQLLSEFRRCRSGMSAIRQQFEKWQLFVNPYEVLRAKLDRQVDRLVELDVKSVTPPETPQWAEQLPVYKARLSECRQVYEEAAALCIDIQLSAPVLGESAVNLLMRLLAKPEIRNDRRVFDDHCRRNIDVRIKGLHLICDGFVGRVDGSEEPFKWFMRLMNDRNDRLHGNVDPAKATGSELYFDHRFIPLYTTSRDLTHLAVERALSSVDPDAAIRDLASVRGLVALLLSKLDAGARRVVEQAFATRQLGYRASTGSIGAILPQSPVAMFIPRRTTSRDNAAERGGAADDRGDLG